jgi:hypothetical protein
LRTVVVGTGAVGARVARQLYETDGCESLVLVDSDGKRARQVANSLGQAARVEEWSPALLEDADVLVLAAPGRQRAKAEAALERRVHVVTTTDDVAEVRALLDLDAEARERALTVAVGAGFAPGLSCVLARHAAQDFGTVDEVHVAKLGTGGPACAKQHHRALAQEAVDYRDGAWTRRPGGSGRELCWFPDPVGGVDCYRGGLPDALLLVPGFTNVQRVTARVAASRRDRISARLPMLRPPHAEGTLGALRVEVRGWRGGTSDVRVLGLLDRPAVAAGSVAAVTAVWAADGRLSRSGAAGLAELVTETVPFLQELARRGVRAAVFEGSASTAPSAV